MTHLYSGHSLAIEPSRWSLLARWDARCAGYAGVVARYAENVVEIDVDGRIGAALAGVIGVMNTPTVAVLENGDVRGRFVGRRRDDAELRGFLAEVTGT